VRRSLAFSIKLILLYDQNMLGIMSKPHLNGKQITSSQATQLVSQAQNIISIIP
jgi:hypothetical protein